MHPFSILTLGIFIAGYITARWDLVTRLYELAIFAWDHGVVARTAQGAAILSLFFFLFIIPAEQIASREATEVTRGRHIGSRATEASWIFLVQKNDTMVGEDGLLRLFWPSDAPRTKRPGVLVGWRNSQYDLFVVSILQDVEARNVDNALRAGILFRNSSHPMARMFQLCGKSSLNVLGTTNRNGSPGPFDPSNLSLYLEPTFTLPQVFCPKHCGISVQIVVYERPFPTKMQYMSLKPIVLALDDKLPDIIPGRSDSDERLKSQLVQKLRLHTVIKHMPSQKELSLPVILRQINCSFELAQLLAKNINLIGTRQRRKLSVGERVVESASTLWGYVLTAIWHVLAIWVYPIIARSFRLGLLCHRCIAEVILRILEWRPRAESAALKDVSATAQQIDIRLQQFCYWPIQYTTLRRRKDDWDSVTDNHPEYIRFYNSLWLVANDVIIGIALGSYIIDNAERVASFVNLMLSDWTVDGLKRMIIWLTDWPAGLKLNNELASFLGDLVLWVIEHWSQCLDSIRPLLPHIVSFVGFSSLAGATMPISLFSDLLSLLTVHIYSFYTASARIYHWQLTIIISLFHLFRGKKHNVLRNRIDSCDYDLDQLLLGTILFTLLSFLLPTVGVFYFTFALSRMAIIALKGLLDTMLACLNHFPLFALMLRVKDSRRLPGGICFELRDTPSASLNVLDSHDIPPTSYIYLKSIPLSLREMFDQYFQLGTRLRGHYLSAGVVFYLLTGQFVPPIHRKNMYSLQYSMLPAQRVDIAEVWKRLNQSQAGSEKAHANGLKIPNGFHSNSRRSHR